MDLNQGFHKTHPNPHLTHFTMSSINTLPFAKPCEWVKSISNLTDEECREYATIYDNPLDMGSAIICLELSSNPDHLNKAISWMYYHLNRDGELYDQFQKNIDKIVDDRWVELIHMHSDISREIVHLMNLRSKCPSPDLLARIANHIRDDPTSIEIITEVWIISNWPLSAELIYIIQDGYSAWKLLHQFNPANDCDSFELLQIATRFNDDWLALNVLLSLNGSTLEYLIHLDNHDMKKTIKTINSFYLWETILHNPAIDQVIEFALNNYHLVESGKHTSYEELRKWIIPKIQGNATVLKFVDINDIDQFRFNLDFFSNPNAIDLIIEWFESEFTSEAFGFEKKSIMTIIKHWIRCELDQFGCMVFDGLVEIASSNNKYAANKAIDIICNRKGFAENEHLNNKHWISLSKGKYSRAIVEQEIKKGSIDDLISLFEVYNIVPYWKVMNDDMQLDNVQVCNITYATINNLNLTPMFENNVKEMPWAVSSNQWKILIQSGKCIDIALANIDLIACMDILSSLIASPLITTQDVIAICNHDGVIDYLDDEVLLALLNRNDAFEIDRTNISDARIQLSKEIIQSWHEPLRLIKFAKSFNMDLYTYLLHQ